CFFAFSVDFSHYLDPGEADICDNITYEAIKAGNTAAIERFTNDNVDSPLCLSTFVRISRALGADIWKADGGNTWSIGAVPYSRSQFPDGVTSYFVLFADH
ncbi:MAG: hypothetical protein J6X60_11875, partial [Ruminiclostridium sp.]|nr:hypothetical protein [Ruminiclostridium sp.]